jgi:hypothetical protein
MTPRAAAALALLTVGVPAACTSFDPYASQGGFAGTRSGSTESRTASDAASGGGDGGAGGAPSGPPDFCSICALSGSSQVAQGALDEASGMAASAVHPGVYYIHNDSGDVPRFFAVNGDGASEGVFSLSATHEDYEDMAVGPCPEGSCVFIADIGDNDEVRASYTLYRAPEPAALASGPVATTPFPFVYEDGPHNAETLLVHPITGEIVIVTKTKSGPSTIFRAPDGWAPGQMATLIEVGEIAPPSGSPRITGGSVHPAGLGVLLRTYTDIYYYPASAPDAPLGETLSHTPCALPVADEPQGEAVSWTRAGDGYLTISEGPAPSLHHVSCHEN